MHFKIFFSSSTARIFYQNFNSINKKLIFSKADVVVPNLRTINSKTSVGKVDEK